MSQSRFLGIDFSGGSAPWRARQRRPTVWIASLEERRLVSLLPVQDLPGDEPPFLRLIHLLKEARYRAAAIDAPFALPSRFMPAGGHAELLEDVAQLPHAGDRPFPSGASLLSYALERSTITEAKPMRETERQYGATRSALWNGARPGAPFAAACLTLLATAQRPVWPWADAHGMLVEAFPAAQLRTWGLPFSSYTAEEHRPTRALIIDHLEDKRNLILDRTSRQAMLETADALDAVLAAFGARAAATGALARERPEAWRTEGAIAVHA